MADTFNIPGLKEAIKDVEKLQESVDKAAKSMLNVAIAGEKATKAIGGDTLKKNVELQKTAKAETDKLVIANEKLTKAQSDEAKELAKINLLIQQQNQINKASAQTHILTTAEINKEATSIAGARAQLALLTQARNNVNVTTEEGKAKLVLLNDALDKNNAFIKNNADAALKQKLAIGDYATGMQTAIEKTGLFQGKLGDVTRTAIGFIQGGAQAVQKIDDINKSVINGAKNVASFVTAKLGLTSVQKAETIAIEAGTIATEENAIITTEAKTAKIGFVQSQKATTVATELNTTATEGNILATEAQTTAQVGVTATSEVMAVAETEAAVATGLLDVALGVLLSPITLVIAAVAALAFIFKDFAPLINPIKDAFAGLMAVFGVIKQDIFDLVTGARSLKDIFFSFGDDATKAASGATELEKSTRELNKAMEINDVAMQQAKTRVQELILQSKNRTLSEKERIKLIQDAQDIEAAAFKKTNDLNERDIKNKRDKLFEGKKLSAEELKFIEANDFAKIRSLKISKNLNDEDLKAYAETLKKKESLLQEDQQIREKAENRKDQIADKKKAEDEKATEKAKKDSDDAQKRAEDAVKKELERRKKQSEMAISTMKLVLDNEIASYDQSQHIADDNLAHVQAISLMKQKIADAESEKELIGLDKNSIEGKAILQKKSEEYQKIEIEKNKALDDIRVKNIDFELELYDFRNQTLIKEGAQLNDLLIAQEKKRLEEEYKMQKDALDKKAGLNELEVKDKLKNNKTLTTAELSYLKQLQSLEDKKNSEIKKNDKSLLDSKIKSIDTEEKLEVRKFKLLQKTSQANTLFELKAKAKALKEEQKLYKDDAKKQDEINDALTANKQEQDKIVSESKRESLNLGLASLIEIAGKESAIGKAAAIAQVTINTIEAASKEFAKNGILGFVTGALISAAGAAQVAKIAGVQMFAEGTDNAPYTGKAIIDEIGPEIHMDKNGNIKSFGSDSGARLTDIAQGDRIIPADVSAIITQTMFASYGMKNLNSDYNSDKLADRIDLSFAKHSSKIVSAVNNQKPSSPNIIIQKDLTLRATFKGKRV